MNNENEKIKIDGKTYKERKKSSYSKNVDTHYMVNNRISNHSSGT